MTSMDSTKAHGEADEDVFDWEAEAGMPRGEKGCQRKWHSSGDPYRFWYRYSEMVWEQRGGRWYGRWHWTEWEELEAWTKRIEDQRQRAHAWKATDVPQEALLWSIECLIGTPLSTTRAIEEAASSRSAADLEWVPGLGNLALVCRAWYTLLAPTLYSKIEVTDEVIGVSPRQSTLQHGRRITVRSSRPLMISAKLSRISPRPSPAVFMRWEGPVQEKQHEEGPPGGGVASSFPSELVSYHPSHADIYAQVHHSYSGIIALHLTRCHFLSSSDLLRLLSSFSALQRVVLTEVSVAQITSSVTRPGRPSTLRDIFAHFGCTPTALPFLTLCWIPVPRPLNSRESPFHGLLPFEQRLLVRISEQVTKDSSQYHLDAMDKDKRTWVLWLRTRSNTLHIELHVSQEDDAARVQHILLRVKDEDVIQALSELSSKFGFEQFGSLETIVLETRYHIENDKVQPLVEALHKYSGVIVRHRTSEEAFTFARRDMTGAACSPHDGLLSPFWCLKGHVWQWDDWLSSKFMQSVPDGDWRGWDPSRPVITAPAVGG